MVNIKIYDVLGRKVLTLVNEYKSLGKYSVAFNAGSLASGVYIYRFVSQPTDGARSELFTSVKKMLLLK